MIVDSIGGLILWVIVLFLIAQVYFLVANRVGILDIPNERSAHKKPIIRGLGILFPLAFLIYQLRYGFIYPFFSYGIYAIAFISLIDDVKPLSNGIRLIIHFLAMTLLLVQVQVDTGFSYWLFLPLLILGVGITNVFNFMDGINGLTGIYSLVTIVFFLIIYDVQSIEKGLLITVVLSLIIFLFYNFRKIAEAFCGDVGSIFLGSFFIFCIYKLVFQGGDWKYIFLLSIYGLDSVYTIIYRLLSGHNIFKAHKLHFYQILVHEVKMSHLKVALLYGMLQAIINLVIYFNFHWFILVIIILGMLASMHILRGKFNVAIMLVPKNK